jgi:hypothetical protein
LARRRGSWQPEDDDLEWFTISYKSIYTALAIVSSLVVCGGLYRYWTHARQTEPSQETSPRHAYFTWIEGRVGVKVAGESEWTAATAKTALKANDLVRTAVASIAEISFFDGTVLHMRPDSLITLEEAEPEANSKERRVAWHVSSGEVVVETGERRGGGPAAVVSTPSSRGTLPGGSAAVIRVARSGASDIRVFEGTADVLTHLGQQLSVGPAERLKVNAAGTAGRKKQLPPPPELDAARELTARPAAGSGASFELSWKPVARAVSYHLVLDQNAHFNWPLVDRRGVKGTSVELRGLDSGYYYWRVATVAADDREGAFSAFGRLVVAPAGAGPAASPPPLFLEVLELRDAILHARGRTEPGAVVTVDTRTAEVRPDGSFDEFVTLDAAGPYEVIVRARGIDGGIAETRRTVIVSGP